MKEDRFHTADVGTNKTDVGEGNGEGIRSFLDGLG